MFKVKITTEPTTWPVSLTEVKAHLHLTDTDNDTQLTDLIKQVTKEVEGFCGISIGDQQRTWTYDHDGCEVSIPYGPVVSVDEVVRIATDGAETVLTSGEDFYVYELSTIKIIAGGRCRVEYTAGVTSGSVAVVPADLKLGILNEIAHRYENRGDTQTLGFSNDALDLIIRHKDYSWE